MKIIIFLWQLPQNLLGLLVIFFTGASKYSTKIENERRTMYWTKKYRFGVCLGDFIIFGRTFFVLSIDEQHEWGHHRQSLFLGWFYLFIIGLPSLLGNIYDRFFHKKWNPMYRIKWYYNQSWEKWADKLGNVNRY